MDGIAMDSVLKELEQLINSEDNLIANESHQIQSLYYDLRFLGTILKDMGEKQLHEQNDEAENLAMQISCVAYETGESSKIGFVFDFRLNLSDIMEQIKPIQVKVMQFYDKIYQIQVLQAGKSSDGVPSMENRTMVEEEITVGFDNKALTVKEQLAGGKKQLHIMSIVGMPGLDKTTLARKVEMLLNILHSVNLLTDEVLNMSNEMLGEKLYKHFKGKRYLIVIDDIWDIGAWVNPKMYLPNDNIGSRVMFTSRHRKVAMHTSPDSQPHCIRFLNEEESWELFQWKVFRKESCPLELIEIGKQIMKKCKGLPLAIVVIAGLLAKNKKTEECWKQVSQKAVVDHSYPCVLANLRTITNLHPCGSALDLLARAPHHTKLGFCGYLILDSRHLVLPNVEFLRHLETSKLHNLSLLKSTDLRGIKFPVNIKRLTLKYTGIKWEEISIIGLLLPNLELLKLESNSAWGLKWETTDGGFHQLKFLKLIRLNLEQWITCSSHFPSLQHLSLDMCAYLEEIPSCLGHIFTVQMIEIFRNSQCTRTVCKSTLKNHPFHSQFMKQLMNEELHMSQGLGPLSGWMSYTSHDVFSQRKAAEQDVARVALDDPSEFAMYKNHLQEYTQKSSIPLPVYETINEGGVPHEPRFRSTVRVDVASYTSHDVFSQRKAAEQDVTKVASDDPPELAMYKNRLQEYTQKSSIPLPVYETINEGEVPHEPRFRSTVRVDVASYTSHDVFSQRKAAEQDVTKVASDGITQKIPIREN
ncbi:unnamed protein product [Camellia sinensis]